MFSAARPTMLAAALLLAISACSGEDDSSAEDDATPVSIGASATTELTTTALITTAGITTGVETTVSPTTRVQTTELVTTEFVTTALVTTGPTTTGAGSALTPTEPTGAPGIDDDDVFCAAWARAIGIPQILTIAANFGGLDSSAMARLEVLAAPAVSAAVASLAETLPTELEGEREVWFARVLGPSASRADRAVALLLAAGATAEDLDTLEAAWLETLRTRDPTSPVPSVSAQDPALEALVDDAAAQFDAEVTPWLDDPALTIDDSIAPAITAYTRDHCPDLSALGIGDDI